MRPSSSASDELFGAVLARGGVAEQVGDAAWLRAMLDVEAALARAGATVGLVPVDAAEAITRACSGTYDLAALGRDAADSGNPVVPLVRAVEAAAGPAGRYVHHGATSQDVLDTAMLLIAHRALAVLLADLAAAADAAALLARRHRDDPMAGRTLLQQALPTTFGLKAAGWAAGLDAAGDRLTAVVLPAQLGGAVGTLSALQGHGTAVLEAFAAELDLAVPVLAWHTLRLPVADLAGALGTSAGVLGKVALDLVLLAQTEVGEVAEGVAGRGGSSTMPHKRNPVASVSARAGALRAPGLVAGLLSSMAQEHERAAGAWHTEWQALSDLLRCTGSSAAWLRDALEHLEVDTVRMRAALAAASGAQAVSAALTGALGRAAAHDLVARVVAAGGDLQAALLAEPDVHLSAGELAALLEPSTGEAGALVDRALAARAHPRTGRP